MSKRGVKASGTKRLRRVYPLRGPEVVDGGPMKGAYLEYANKE